MDVRCEKCSTEYELDEARLKPGGVTVKCTNCGHTFKVRKKEAAPAAADVPATMMGMPRGPAPATPAPAAAAAAAAAAAGERQWLIRENGETRSCRELATLQQWILAGEVTRDALISRSGKTWKLLGDIVELGTYFTIADEAKQQRSRRESAKSALAKKGEEVPRQTLVGVGPVSSGSMALGDLDNEEIGDNDPTKAHKPAPARAPSATDEVQIRTTAPHAAGAEPVAARRSGVPSQPASNVPSGVAATVPSMHHSQPHAQPAHHAPSAPASHPSTPMPAGWPANPPATASGVGTSGPSGPSGPSIGPSGPSIGPSGPSGPSGPMSGVPQAQHSMPWMVPPALDTSASAGPSSGPSGPTPVDGPMRGRLQQQAGDEPAFAGGRSGPRTPLASSQPFTGMARDASPSSPSHPGLGGFGPDDDHGPAVAPRGSRAGLWIAIASLAVIAGGFATVWLLVLRSPEEKPEAAPDAGVAVVNPPIPNTGDAGVTPPEPPPVVDAGAALPPPPTAAAGAAELAGNVEARMRAAISALADGASKDEAQALAMRARLFTAIAQSLEDRAALALPSEKSAADKLRQKSKEAVLEAMPLAQRALKAAPTDASANLAMADLLRLQGKSARDLKRYLDAARAAAPGAPDLAILDGLLLIKEGKLGDARALWTKADAGEAKLEQSGDVRLRFRSAVAALADGKAVDARAAVESVVAAQPEHEGAKVLLARLDQSVANTDPLPPEEGTPPEGSGSNSSGSSGSSGISPSDSFEKLVKKADELAEKSCTKAIPVYQAALDKNPTGIPALVGLGYCHIDTKQFSSANSRFRTVLALSSKNERALWGIAQAYQEQGLKSQAVEAYRNYLEVFPSSEPAKRQIDRLGGDAPSGGDKPSGDKPAGDKPAGDKPAGGDTPTTTPSPETPATPPAGGAAGAGGTAGESAQDSAQ